MFSIDRKSAPPSKLRCSGGVQIGEEDRSSRTQHPADLLGKVAKTPDIAAQKRADNEICTSRGERHVPAVAKEKLGGAAKFVFSLLQHFGGEIHSHQACRISGRQPSQPSASATSKVDNIQPSHRWQQGLKKSFFQCQQGIWLGIIDTRPQPISFPWSDSTNWSSDGHFLE